MATKLREKPNTKGTDMKAYKIKLINYTTNHSVTVQALGTSLDNAAIRALNYVSFSNQSAKSQGYVAEEG